MQALKPTSDNSLRASSMVGRSCDKQGRKQEPVTCVITAPSVCCTPFLPFNSTSRALLQPSEDISWESEGLHGAIAYQMSTMDMLA